MPNRQTQDQQDKGRKNPGTFSPDDDEAQEADRTHASDMSSPQKGGKSRGTEDLPADIVDEDDEEADDDEDESDGIGARP